MKNMRNLYGMTIFFHVFRVWRHHYVIIQYPLCNIKFYPYQLMPLLPPNFFNCFIFFLKLSCLEHYSKLPCIIIQSPLCNTKFSSYQGFIFFFYWTELNAGLLTGLSFYVVSFICLLKRKQKFDCGRPERWVVFFSLKTSFSPHDFFSDV